MGLQHDIGAELGVSRDFDARTEADRRIGFLKDYLRAAGQRCYVLGISGGVDSTTAGRLAQLAVEQLRAEGCEARFVAMRLPYGRQRDEADARAALDFIRPDEVLSVDIQPAADAMLAALRAGGLAFNDPAHEDFVLGNVKARQRMIAQYAVAGARGGLVIGTDQAAEAVMGFFTKHGDGACDLVPLAGLDKRRVRALASHLGAPDALVTKVPTADLENLAPLKPDEAAYGVTYDEIDDYLEGKAIGAHAASVIEDAYRRTAHKRALPAQPPQDGRGRR